MSTITMHGVDKTVDRHVRELAKKENTSINRTVQSLLRQALGLESAPADHRRDFQDIAGCWSEKDLKEFTAVTKTFSKIDPEDW